jgi:hypothetical protein
VRCITLNRCSASIATGEQCRHSVGREKEYHARKIIANIAKLDENRLRRFTRHTLCATHANAEDKMIAVWHRILQSDALLMARSLLVDYKFIWNTTRASRLQAARQNEAESQLTPVSDGQKQKLYGSDQLLERSIGKTFSEEKLRQWNEELLLHGKEQRRWEKECLGHEKTRQIWEQERLDHETIRRRWEKERVDHENTRLQWEKERIEHEEANLKRGKELFNHETIRQLWEEKCVEHVDICHRWEKELIDHEELSCQRDKERRVNKEKCRQWDEERRQWEEERCANEKMYLEWEEERCQWHLTGVLHAQKYRLWKEQCHQRETELRRWDVGWTNFVHNWDILSSLSIPSNGKCNTMLSSWPNKVGMRLLRSEGIGEGFFDKILRTPLWSEHGFSETMRRSLHGHDEKAVWASARFANGIKAAFDISRGIE